MLKILLYAKLQIGPHERIAILIALTCILRMVIHYHGSLRQDIWEYTS